MLTEQQKNFCREYVIDFLVIKAMVRAGYSNNYAEKNGWKLLQRPDVALYVKQLMENQMQRQELTADMVLSEIRKLAFSDISTYFKWSDKKSKYVLKPISELTTEQRAAIAEYSPGERYKLYSKDAALDKLAKYFKLYSDINAQVTNFVLMPDLKLNGKKLEFDVGKPAPNTPSVKAKK